MTHRSPLETTASAVTAAATEARRGGRDALAAALRASRASTLALLDAYVTHLGESLRVPRSEQLNPPLWEVGHVAWFQDYWVVRNLQRALGLDCAPEHARPVGRLAHADAWYNSSQVAHDSRWQLPLPDVSATRAYLAASLEDTLALLARTEEGDLAEERDRALYFFRLALFHEDMHAEAAIYMAQALGIPLPVALAGRMQSVVEPALLALPEKTWCLGYQGDGFAFDNELHAHDVKLQSAQIDSEVMSWRRYLPFLTASGTPPPRYLRLHEGHWQRCHFGQWESLPLDLPATHLTWFEADAWCRWAGRRLPGEAEWEAAAVTRAEFHRGQVWEWTSSRFEPYPGFVAHPYRDYSAPWFGTRYVLRGGSCATSPRMKHPRYRNFFTPERNDVHTGFRSCAL